MGSHKKVKCSHCALQLFYATCPLFYLFIDITSRNMASKAKCYQIVAWKSVGICTRDLTEQLDMWRKTVFNVSKRYTETDTTSSKFNPGPCTKLIVQAVMKWVK